jgi:hypothetical protein
VLETLRKSLSLLATRRFGTFWFASLLSSIGTWGPAGRAAVAAPHPRRLVGVDRARFVRHERAGVAAHADRRRARRAPRLMARISAPSVPAGRRARGVTGQSLGRHVEPERGAAASVGPGESLQVGVSLRDCVACSPPSRRVRIAARSRGPSQALLQERRNRATAPPQHLRLVPQPGSPTPRRCLRAGGRVPAVLTEVADRLEDDRKAEHQVGDPRFDPWVTRTFMLAGGARMRPTIPRSTRDGTERTRRVRWAGCTTRRRGTEPANGEHHEECLRDHADPR